MDEVKWLIAREIPRLRRYAAALADSPEAADDLVQDCLERAIRKRGQWKREGSIRSWLYRILYTVFLNQSGRRRRRQDEVPIDDMAAPAVEPARQEEQVICADIAEAMRRLPADQRAAIALTAIEGLSYEQAARVLRVPIGTVRSRLFRGRERLPIGELDLLAYADDPLALEPQRRAAVEAYLRGHPEDAARVETFRQQSRALRERYDSYLHAPVPPRLHEALEARPGRGRPLLRHAAAASIVAATAAAGWIAGERYGGPPPVTVERSALPAVDGDAGASPWAGASQAAEPVAVAGLLEYGAGLPELSHLGFSLVSAEPASGPSSPVARLTYAAEDGRRFTLMLRSRWHDRSPGFQVEKRGELSVVSWEEGRLAAELTSRVGREEALEIAEAVRAALKALAPAGPAATDGLLAVGSAEPAAEAGGAALPQQIR